ncbi:hypothetical protein [Moraxella cuniculi]|nr:hypothetical protein [Moraxella cuniculi]
MKKFKVGDKVYCPTLGRGVYKVMKYLRGGTEFPLCVYKGGREFSFTHEGFYYSTDKVSTIHHATEENHAALEQLYGVEFEKPPAKPEPIKIIQAMILRGDKYVPCYVGDDEVLLYEDFELDFLFGIDQYDSHPFCGHRGSWKYALPVELRTGKVITTLPDDVC